MKQYLITAYDATDEHALARRMAVRPFHLEGAKKLKKEGHFILGGTMLDNEGKIIGSTMVLQFEDESQLQDWMDNEPYLQENIWVNFSIQPFSVAQI
jgi:uncharacterized protein YciI